MAGKKKGLDGQTIEKTKKALKQAVHATETAAKAAAKTGKKAIKATGTAAGQLVKTVAEEAPVVAGMAKDAAKATGKAVTKVAKAVVAKAPVVAEKAGGMARTAVDNTKKAVGTVVEAVDEMRKAQPIEVMGEVVEVAAEDAAPVAEEAAQPAAEPAPAKATLPEKLKILYATSECAPFVKTGGLADVAGALPKALCASADVRVILPKYRWINEYWRSRMTHLMHFYVHLGWRQQYVGIDTLTLDGVTYYFLDNEYYYGHSYVYGSGDQEAERFAFLCRAVLDALPHLGFIPDVLHVNDWQTGMIPVLLETQYRTLPMYQNIKTIFTIHNLQYQGTFAWPWVQDLLGLDESLNTSDKLEHFGGCSFMKAALVYSHLVTTVSPTYAREIQQSEMGERMDGLLFARRDSLHGILNGIDMVEYDPAGDEKIAARYSADDRSGKAFNKGALQRELALEEDPDVPVIGIIGRLSSQKGLDLVEQVLDGIMATGAQMAVLGMGDEHYVNMLGWAQWRYPGRFAFRCEMNDVLAHRIYAGADLLLMPSRFEPCGLSQMIALRYGTLPIVRETGGLRDTVLSYNEQTGEGNGFTFHDYDAEAMLCTIQRATRYYYEQKQIWHTLMDRAMRGDYSWDKSAKAYMDLYRSLVK